MLKRFFDWLSGGECTPDSHNDYLDLFNEDYRIF